MKNLLVLIGIIGVLSLLAVVNQREEYSSIGVSFNFKSIEEGRFIDGKKIDSSEILSDDILKEVYEKVEGLHELDYYSFRNSLEVTEPSSKRLKEIENELKESKSINRGINRINIYFYGDIDTLVKEQALKSIVDLYRQKEVEKRFLAEKLGENHKIIYEDYFDFENKIYMTKKKNQGLKEFLYQKISSEHNEYSKQYKNILEELIAYEKVYMLRVDNILKSKKLVKRKEFATIRKEEELKSLNSLKNKKENERKVLEELIVRYKPTEEQVVIASGNYSNTYDVEAEKKYFSQLIEKLTGVGVEIVRLEEEIKYLKEDLKKLNEDKDVEKELLRNLLATNEKHNDSIASINKFIEMERSRYYSGYMKVEEVVTGSIYNRQNILFSLMGLALFLFSLNYLYKKLIRLKKKVGNVQSPSFN